MYLSGSALLAGVRAPLTFAKLCSVLFTEFHPHPPRFASTSPGMFH